MDPDPGASELDAGSVRLLPARDGADGGTDARSDAGPEVDAGSEGDRARVRVDRDSDVGRVGRDVGC